MSGQNEITSLILGIKYSRSFRIPDISGEIVDDLLYGKNTPFSIDVFKKVESREYERVIVGDNASDYIRINIDDFILSVSVDNDFAKKMAWLKKKVVPYIEHLFLEYRIKPIRRVGFVFVHTFKSFKEIDSIVETVTYGQIKGANNIKLAFTKKFPVGESVFRHEVLDYKNVIQTLEQKDNTFVTNLDFQYNYEPMVSDIRDAQLIKLIDDSEHYLNDTYYQWIGNYVKKKEKQK